MMWRKARKKPIVIEFREPLIEGELIRTRKGVLEAEYGKHYIIRGVEGDVYPIEISTFFKTYEMVDDSSEGTGNA